MSKQEFKSDLEYQRAFGQNIRRIRESVGWTQVDLAVHAGVSEYQISVIENGHQGPGFQTLCALAVALGRQPQELFDFKHALKVNSNFPKEKRKPGTTKLINSLIETGFFKELRTVREVTNELRSVEKIDVRTSEVSAVLLAISQRNKLKITRSNGKNYYRLRK